MKILCEECSKNTKPFIVGDGNIFICKHLAIKYRYVLAQGLAPLIADSVIIGRNDLN